MNWTLLILSDKTHHQNHQQNRRRLPHHQKPQSSILLERCLREDFQNFQLLLQFRLSMQRQFQVQRSPWTYQHCGPPTSCKWPYKLPLGSWGSFTPINGDITLLITRLRAHLEPMLCISWFCPCSHSEQVFKTHQWHSIIIWWILGCWFPGFPT